MMRGYAAWAAVVVVLAVPMTLKAQDGGVTGSRHDLTSNGPGPVKATTEKEVCLFCHAPHNVKPAVPLWNHELSQAKSYTPYYSSTFQQTPTQPTDRSKLCLSCHDGTVALGQTVANGLIATTGSLSPKANLGTDLASDHPFAFPMPAKDDGEIRSSLTRAPVTTADDTVKLFDNKIECTTCHDPHKADNDKVVQKFLVRDNAAGALCTACHDPSRGVLSGWSSGKHAMSSGNTISTAAIPYDSVATSACMVCHDSHNTAGTGAQLLRGVEETACSNCHGAPGNIFPAAPNVMDVLNSTYKHPVVQVADKHDPAEALPVNVERHSECADCHNPHSAQAGGGTVTRPLSPPALVGASGVDASNGTDVLRPAANEYEVCFKCHANSTNKPQKASYSDYGRTPYRQTFSGVSDPYNVRLDLLSQVARHNVVLAAGTARSSRPANVPSLRLNMLPLTGTNPGASLQAGTFIYCTDCHNNDGTQTSVKGPHGSKYPHLLERRYEVNQPIGGAGGAFSEIVYSPGINGPYALCDKCHYVDERLMKGDPVFGRHSRHVNNGRLSCSACHAAHGVQNGTVGRNDHLINLDLAIAGPLYDRQGLAVPGTPYIDTVNRSCYVTCHGVNHNGRKY